MPKHARKSRSYYIIRSAVRGILCVIMFLIGMISLAIIIDAIEQIGR